MIELASRIWNSSIPNTIARLVHEGMAIPSNSFTDRSVSNYVTQQIGSRHRRQQFWKDCQHHLVFRHSAEINSLKKKLGLQSSLNRDREIAGPCRLYGAATRNEVETLFQPTNDPAHRRGESLTFRGVRGTYKDVLVVPYFCTPNKISSFLFVCRSADKVTRVYRHTQDQHIAPGYTKETGLAGLQTAFNHHADFVIAMEDPLLMLKWQVRHFNTSLHPLPLVSWKSNNVGMTRDAWTVLNRKRLIFWSSKITVDLLVQCHRTDAHLCIFEPRSNGNSALGHYVRAYQPLDLIRKIQTEAKPWRDVVRHWMEVASDSEISQLMTQILPVDKSLWTELQACGRMTSIANHPQMQNRLVRLDAKRDVIERGDCWYVRSNNAEHRALDATFQLTRIIKHTQTCLVYEGYISQHGRKVDFQFSSSSKPQDIVTSILDLGRAAGMQLHVGSKVSLLAISYAFHPPAMIQELKHIGWDNDRFVFKQFQVRHGVVSPSDPGLLPLDCPGPQLDPDFRVGKLILEQLTTKNVETEVCWAIAAGLTASVIALPASEDIPVTLLSGEGLRGPSNVILERFGVPTCILQRESANRNHRVEADRWPHHWPRCVRHSATATVTYLHRWLLDTEVRHTCSYVSASVGKVLVLHGGFNQIDFDGVLRAVNLAAIPLEYIIPSYLRYVTKHRFKLKPRGTWYETVLTDMASWIESEGGDPAVVLAAMKHVTTAGSPHLLEKTIASMYRLGNIRADIREANRFTIPVSFNSKGIVLTRNQFLQACNVMRVVPPEVPDMPETMTVSRDFIN